VSSFGRPFAVPLRWERRAMRQQTHHGRRLHILDLLDFLLLPLLIRHVVRLPDQLAPLILHESIAIFRVA
jgi:hypothetical protein